ncbi:putative manganese-dependent inorganic diphosphatase [Opitutaceae bacterium TAV4]|uniref:putative manganese-dependent inorganic diphosphatase n=1 Tax=Geminisphaera colitermitum TaxID=1148786 RepID=UPI000158CB36|nr:putative manganese-dependent inorganic diphosphatase [Geminisphaera colitermitum]RRJ96551.1 putative manganese-dependent inorganic diphosphatase [Opitutaceae bacterium TAV4]RRK00602.1 putative manganese-dependent inorganic diphosphatase [Opitutaceae bacterium TAV3]
MSSAPFCPLPTITTYVIGHKNPDADSVCSAIGYAAYKEARGHTGYIAARAGNSNARIDTILHRFQHPLPLLLSDVTPRVRDIMVPASDVVSIGEEATCAEALELIDEHDVRVLPVVTEDRRVLGTLSIFQLGGFFVPRIRAVRELRKVHTNIDCIVRALKARVLHATDSDRLEELFVRIGAMDVRSFWKIAQDDGIPAGQAVIIVGDRWDIQQRSIQVGVRLLVLTGDLPVEEEIIHAAQQKGVSLIVSAYDSATTAWIIRTATRIHNLIDRQFSSISAELRLSDVRRKLASSSAAAHVVLDDEGHLQGILTKTDMLKPVRTQLVLVDHNEMTQAVTGADHVTITEVIDHHRLGAMATQQPILFINEPVGSTCTIVADLFRRDNLRPTPQIAGILMSGIIADTLHLNSPTSTEKDSLLLNWLSQIADVDSRQLADEIFSSGSIILSSAPDTVIRSDFKIYDEDNIRFSVSQVEELGFGNFWKHSKQLASALERLCVGEALAFACLLVTDINTQNSLLVVKGSENFIRRITYPAVEHDEIFDMPGIVSRKKQLIPYLTTVLHEMSAEGLAPAR